MMKKCVLENKGGKVSTNFWISKTVIKHSNDLNDPSIQLFIPLRKR